MGAQALPGSFLSSGQAHARRIKTRTLEGDLDDDALTESVYKPTADEQRAPAVAEGELPPRHSTIDAAGAPRTVWVGMRYAFGR